MKEKIQKNGWFQYFFINCPVGFILLLILGGAGFLVISSSIKIPIYKTFEAIIAQDTEGRYIIMPEDMIPHGEPFYVYQEREQYVEKVKEYNVKVKEQAVYMEDSNFLAGTMVSVDVETQRITLLSYVFKNV